MSRRRQQTALGDRIGAGRSRGKGEGPDVWRSAGDKPMVKSHRVERESEGPIVPLRPGETREEGRGPAWVALVAAGAGEGMVS
jgi:hypothetical protein